MPATATNRLVLSPVASGAITSFRGVTVAGAQAGAGANSLGPSMNSAAIGEAVPVVVLGTAVGEAGAAVAVGALLEHDASGRYITRSAGVSVGRALTAAGAAGDQIEILLIPN